MLRPWARLVVSLLAHNDAVRTLTLSLNPSRRIVAVARPPDYQRIRVLMAANNVRAEVVEREFGGSIRRGKGPLRLKTNPLHRKAERAMQAFS